ncbi:MAG: GNAT family N-acetyltransferase [Aestuariibacter sp.]
MIHVRDFINSDFDAVATIYQQGIDTGIATFQTQCKSFGEWDASLLPECRLVAANPDNAVLGWAGLSSVSSRCVYAGVAEVTIYIAQSARGQGVGFRLLAALVDASEKQGIWSLKAGIFPENRASIALHEKCGFRQIGIQEKLGKLKGKWQDVLLMERRSKTVGVD